MPKKNKKIIIIEPHAVISREVTEKDLPRVIEDGKKLHILCNTKIGLYENAYAMAHSQITKTDPLRFFVENNGTIIVNPKIVRKSGLKQRKIEGCITFAESPKKMVERHTKVTVEFQYVQADGTLSPPATVNMSGIIAQTFQHEIFCHFDCKYIYTYIKPQKAIDKKVKNVVK